MSARRPPCGQASVEVVALLPLALLIALAIGQALAFGTARELAGAGAEAGAIALVQGTDADAAAREAVPGWAAKRVEVSVDGRRVRVRLRPRALLPGLSGALRADASADAGPER
jgi:hypothetical protein